MRYNQSSSLSHCFERRLLYITSLQQAALVNGLHLHKLEHQAKLLTHPRQLVPLDTTSTLCTAGQGKEDYTQAQIDHRSLDPQHMHIASRL